MKAKRMLSLVMAAVLALCVLAGCRGGRALSQVMAGLLEGQYAAEIAMVEAEGGYYIAVDVKIVKAGKPDTDDDDEEVGDNYIVNTPEGLMDLFEAENGSDFENKTITLQAGETYIVKEQLASTFKGTLNGNNATITLTGGSSLFGTIGEIILDEDDALDYINKTGTVQNLQIKVTDSIIVGDGAQHNESANAGAVAGENYNSISGCTVTIESGGSIKANNDNACAGGVAGCNSSGSISGCTVTISGTVSASNSKDGGNARAGGVVGDNDNGTVNGSCKLNDGKIEAKVGENIATVTEGDKDGTETAGNVAYAGIKIGYEPAPRPLPPEVPGT